MTGSGFCASEAAPSSEGPVAAHGTPAHLADIGPSAGSGKPGALHSLAASTTLDALDLGFPLHTDSLDEALPRGPPPDYPRFGKGALRFTGLPGLSRMHAVKHLSLAKLPERLVPDDFTEISRMPALTELRAHRGATGLGSRAGASGHHRFAARRLLRHRRRLETPRPPSGPAPGHHSSRARGHRRNRTRPRTPPMAPVVERTATVLRTGGTAGRTETTAERTTGNTKGAAPGPKSRGSPARSRSGRAQRVTRPCSGSAPHRRPPARSAGRPAAPTSPHPGR